RVPGNWSVQPLARDQRVVHGLTLAQQVRRTAPVADVDGVVLRLGVERLHDPVEQVVMARAEEVEHRRAAEDVSLQLHILHDRGCSEGRGADTGEVLGRALVEQLWAGDADDLDADAEYTVVVHVGWCQRARAGEADPRRIRPGLGEQTPPKV